MSDHEELIEEAESWVAHTKPSVVGAILRDMISALESVRAERDAAEARIAEVAKLHQPESFHDEPIESFCKTCQRTSGVWPCGTAIALGLNEGENTDV